MLEFYLILSPRLFCSCHVQLFASNAAGVDVLLFVMNKAMLPAPCSSSYSPSVQKKIACVPQTEPRSESPPPSRSGMRLPALRVQETLAYVTQLLFGPECLSWPKKGLRAAGQGVRGSAKRPNL